MVYMKMVNLRVRLGRFCVELHQGTVSKMLSLTLLASTRLHGNWVKIRCSNSPTMQWEKTPTQSHSQHQGARAIRLLYRSDRGIKEELYRVRTNFWIQSSRLFPDFFPKQQFLFPTSRLSNLVINTFLRFSKNPKKQSLHDALQTYGRDWIRFDKNEENFTYI